MDTNFITFLVVLFFVIIPIIRLIAKKQKENEEKEAQRMAEEARRNAVNKALQEAAEARRQVEEMRRQLERKQEDSMQSQSDGSSERHATEKPDSCELKQPKLVVTYTGKKNGDEKPSKEFEYKELAAQFRAMNGYKDTAALAEECERQYHILKDQREEKERLEAERKREQERAEAAARKKKEIKRLVLRGWAFLFMIGSFVAAAVLICELDRCGYYIREGSFFAVASVFVFCVLGWTTIAAWRFFTIVASLALYVCLSVIAINKWEDYTQFLLGVTLVLNFVANILACVSRKKRMNTSGNPAGQRDEVVAKEAQPFYLDDSNLIINPRNW